MSSSERIEGLSELSRALKQLPQNIAKNVLRGAVNAGATVIRNQAVLNAPIYHGEVSKGHPPPGTLKLAIRQKHIQGESDDQHQVFIVFVKKGDFHSYVNNRRNRQLGRAAGFSVSNGAHDAQQWQDAGDAYYWWMVEFGNSHAPAHPFLRPAFETRKMEAVERIKQYLIDRIPLEAAKLNIRK